VVDLSEPRAAMFREPSGLLRSRVSCSRHELGLKGMGRYVALTVVSEGVRAYAVDPTNAEALWKKSEEMVGESF
jgi:hypothetical protein